jgi:hypothetical protein
LESRTHSNQGERSHGIFCTKDFVCAALCVRKRIFYGRRQYLILHFSPCRARRSERLRRKTNIVVCVHIRSVALYIGYKTTIFLSSLCLGSCQKGIMLWASWYMKTKSVESDIANNVINESFKCTQEGEGCLPKISNNTPTHFLVFDFAWIRISSFKRSKADCTGLYLNN